MYTLDTFFIFCTLTNLFTLFLAKKHIDYGSKWLGILWIPVVIVDMIFHLTGERYPLIPYILAIPMNLALTTPLGYVFHRNPMRGVMMVTFLLVSLWMTFLEMFPSPDRHSNKSFKMAHGAIHFFGVWSTLTYLQELRDEREEKKLKQE